MKTRFTAMLLFTMLFLASSAQNTHNERVMQAFSDSLKELSASYYAYHRMWDDMEVPTPKWIKPNPYFYKLYVPPTYYIAPIEQAFEMEWEPGIEYMSACDSIYKVKSDSLPKFIVPDVKKSVKVDRWVNRILLQCYLQYPDHIMGNELYFAEVKALDESQLINTPRKEKMKSYMQVENPLDNTNAESELIVFKPNFWTKSANASLQFTQHAISDNWYQGGESTNALLSDLRLTANYNDKQRVKWENSLELKLGFITAPSDTVHKYKTNADMLRLNSKLGIQAIKNWYYTLTATFKTQFFPNYKTNTDNLISSFLSPAQFDVSLGMDYKLNTSKYTLSVSGYPLSYTHVSLRDKDIVNPSSFGVDAGKSSANLYGSKITADLNWKIKPNIIYITKFEYFTTYESVRINWENTVEFKLNRYLSTKLFLHPRYDDAVTLSGDNDSYFQIKEMLTFGLSYSW